MWYLLAASLDFFFPCLMFEAFNLSRQMSLLPAPLEAIFITRGAARRKKQEIHLLSRGHLLFLLRIPQQLDLAVTRAWVIDQFIGFVHQMLEDAVGILLAESGANRLDESGAYGWPWEELLGLRNQNPEDAGARAREMS